MRKADILLRMNQMDEGKDNNVHEIILLEQMIVCPTIGFNPAKEHLVGIKEAYEKQAPSVSKALKECKPSWRERDRIITFQEQIYIPKNKSLRGEIFKAHHDLPTTGHSGHYKTLVLVS